MAIRPHDLDEFFRRLGERRVRKSVINGELTGVELVKAQLWLEGHQGTKGKRLTALGIALASLIGLLAAAVSYLAP